MEAALALFHPAVRTWFERRFPGGPTEPQAAGGPRSPAARTCSSPRPPAREDLRRLPRVHRPAPPARRGGGRRAPRREVRVRLAAQGARGRRREEPGRPWRRSARSRASSGSSCPAIRGRCGAATPRRRAAPGDAPPPAPHPRHHARVALPAPHLGGAAASSSAALESSSWTRSTRSRATSGAAHLATSSAGSGLCRVAPAPAHRPVAPPRTRSRTSRASSAACRRSRPPSIVDLGRRRALDLAIEPRDELVPRGVEGAVGRGPRPHRGPRRSTARRSCSRTPGGSSSAPATPSPSGWASGGGRAPRSLSRERRLASRSGSTPATSARGGDRLARARHRHRHGGPRLPARVAARHGVCSGSAAPATRGADAEGPLFPVSRDELVECAALVRRLRDGRLDAMVARATPLDVLAQQIVAEAACGRRDEDDALRPRPARLALRELSRARLRRGRSSCSPTASPPAAAAPRTVHRDRSTACYAAGGAPGSPRSPAAAPSPTRPATAVLARAGGTCSRDGGRGLRRGEHGRRRLPARQHLLAHPPHRGRRGAGRGRARARRPASPSGAARRPARTRRALGGGVRLRDEVEARLEHDRERRGALPRGRGRRRPRPERGRSCDYLAASRAVLGAVPTQGRSSPSASSTRPAACSSSSTRRSARASTGPRPRAPQALLPHASTSSCRPRRPTTAILLSLGPQHSFPLDVDLRARLAGDASSEVLTQAAAPVAAVRGALALERDACAGPAAHARRARVPPPIQRMRADDLLAAVFPAPSRCQDNATAAGRSSCRTIRSCSEALRDCLHEAMDIDGPRAPARPHRRAARSATVARDLPSPRRSRTRS